MDFVQAPLLRIAHLGQAEDEVIAGIGGQHAGERAIGHPALFQNALGIVKIDDPAVFGLERDGIAGVSSHDHGGIVFERVAAGDFDGRRGGGGKREIDEAAPKAGR